LDGISLINLAIVPRVYVDRKTMRVRFNTGTENLEIIYGVETEGGFISEAGAISNDDYVAQTFIRFDIIMSINRSITLDSLYGTYYKRSF